MLRYVVLLLWLAIAARANNHPCDAFYSLVSHIYRVEQPFRLIPRWPLDPNRSEPSGGFKDADLIFSRSEVALVADYLSLGKRIKQMEAYLSRVAQDSGESFVPGSDHEARTSIQFALGSLLLRRLDQLEGKHHNTWVSLLVGTPFQRRPVQLAWGSELKFGDIIHLRTFSRTAIPVSVAVYLGGDLVLCRWNGSPRIQTLQGLLQFYRETTVESDLFVNVFR